MTEKTIFNKINNNYDTYSIEALELFKEMIKDSALSKYMTINKVDEDDEFIFYEVYTDLTLDSKEVIVLKLDIEWLKTNSSYDIVGVSVMDKAIGYYTRLLNVDEEDIEWDEFYEIFSFNKL